jgi:glycosyltransferase involved in cell wall biosynthesis
MNIRAGDQATSAPLVSIVIPFYHSYTQYFEECLDSVQAQTYTNWELIVVDDASPDWQAAATVEKRSDPRMRLIRHERNRGQAAARNTGIRNCRGKYFLPLDCDDLLAPTHVEKLMGALNANPGSNLAYADYRVFAAGSGTLKLPVLDMRDLLREQWIPHPGTLMLRSLWERAQGYCEDDIFRAGNEDWDFFLSIAENGLHAVRVPEALYHYRLHQTSISSTRFGIADYLTREFMYVRHQQLFDQFNMKRTFLAGGYRISAIAFWQKGAGMQALKLLLRSVWLSPREFIRIGARRLTRSTLSSES